MGSENIRADVWIASEAADELTDAAPDLTLWQRGAAAGIASLISSLALNPLDVVKVSPRAGFDAAMLRMHAEAPRVLSPQGSELA